MIGREQKGFTLIELMIVIAIIGILASIAVPQYSKYMNRSKFSELVVATSTIKTAIAECYHWNGLDFAKCNTSVPVANEFAQVTASLLTKAASPDSIASITVTADGNDPRITVTPSGTNGLQTSDTFILTGETSVSSSGSRRIDGWSPSGGGCLKGYC